MPWEAPILAQQACGIIIGKQYPKPLVVHDTVMKVNMDRMTKAYAAAKAQAADDDDDDDDEAEPATAKSKLAKGKEGKHKAAEAAAAAAAPKRSK